MTEPFTVLERLVLQRSLSLVTGSIETLRAVDKFERELEFGKKEQEGLKDQNFSLLAPGPSVEIECSPLVKVAVQSVLKAMDKNGKWNEEHPDQPPRLPVLDRIHLPLWERFIEGKAPQRSPDGEVKEPAEVEV